MPITQQIGQFPEAPNSTSDTPQEFNTKANNFVSYQALAYVPEVNQWAVEANQLAVDINNIVATLPSGTINDTTIGADKVYSNQKTEATYKITSGIEGSIAWTKYPDGTLLAQGYVVLSQSTNSTVYRGTVDWGSVSWRGQPRITFERRDLPAIALRGIPIHSAIVHSGSVSFSVNYISNVPIVEMGGVVVDYIALGRWKPVT